MAGPDSEETEFPAVSDAEMLARFQASKKRPPCTETLGFRLVDVNQAERTIRAEFSAPDSFCNPSGAVQGGFIAAMLDETMSTCAIVASNVTMNAPTLEMKVSFLGPLFPGRAVCAARILKWGKTFCFIEADLFDAEGKLVARASATQAPKPFKRF